MNIIEQKEISIAKERTTIEYHIPVLSSTGFGASIFMNYLNMKCAESIDIDTGLSGLWGFLNLWIGLSGKYREALYNGGLLCYNEKTVKKSE